MHQLILKKIEFKPHKLTIYEMGTIFLILLLSFSLLSDLNDICQSLYEETTIILYKLLLLIYYTSKN